MPVQVREIFCYLDLGYTKWENFEKVIQKAKDARKNVGEEIVNHFPDVREMVTHVPADKVPPSAGPGLLA